MQTILPHEPDTISLTSFARLVTLHCRLAGHEPDQADLDQWLAILWPRVEADMSPRRWAAEYLAALAVGEKR